jgi:hypothetical protein
MESLITVQPCKRTKTEINYEQHGYDKVNAWASGGVEPMPTMPRVIIQQHIVSHTISLLGKTTP